MSSSANLSYKTFDMDRFLVLSAAVLLMISAMQDFLAPRRRTDPVVIIQALTRLLLGIFIVYFFISVLKR